MLPIVRYSISIVTLHPSQLILKVLLIFGNMATFFEFIISALDSRARDNNIKERRQRLRWIFFQCLRHRGYSSETLLPLFKKTVDNAKKYPRFSLESWSCPAAKQAKSEESKHWVFLLHLHYDHSTTTPPPYRSPFQHCPTVVWAHATPSWTHTSWSGWKWWGRKGAYWLSDHRYRRAPKFGDIGDLFFVRKIQKQLRPFYFQASTSSRAASCILKFDFKFKFEIKSGSF